MLKVLKKERKMKKMRIFFIVVLIVLKTVLLLKEDLKKINGIGPTTERIILEILKTGSSSYYEKLLTG